MEFKLVRKNDVDTFNREVNLLLAEGYRPYGEPQMLLDVNKTYIGAYALCLVKETQTKTPFEG